MAGNKRPVKGSAADRMVDAAVESKGPDAPASDDADFVKVDVLPWIMVHVVQNEESEFPEGIVWPDLVACPPEKGDFIQPISGGDDYVGMIEARTHVMTEAGPVLQLVVRSVDLKG